MTTRVDVEEIETTRGEKLLATVLAVFVLIGLLWVYFHVDVERRYELRAPSATAADRSALDRYDRALAKQRAARRREADSRRQLVDRREAYRTALDEGRRDARLEGRYRTAQDAYATAQSRRRASRRAALAAAPAARAAQRRADRASRRAEARVEQRRRHDDRVSLARRLALVLLALGASYLLLGRLRARRSRYLPVAMAAIAAVALLALVMAVDYLSDYIEITDLGVLVLSGFGVLMTLVAFVGLQRYLARRIPERRVRKRECPFCGYPAGDNRHCEGCGRDVRAACSNCGGPRRVGTRHCHSCGAA